MKSKKNTSPQTENRALKEAFTQRSRRQLSKEDIAHILKTTPDALAAFEEAYRYNVLDHVSDNFFEVNSRQAAKQHEKTSKKCIGPGAQDIANTLTANIVRELLACTDIIAYEGATAEYEARKALPDGTPLVTLEEIEALPAELRPQLSGSLIASDMSVGSSSEVLLYEYAMSQTERNPELRRRHYHMFRQGLDILDLDATTYAIIDTNPNSMSHWLPALIQACAGQSFFRIPKTRIAKVPLPILQLTRQPYDSLSPTTISIVNQWAHKAFQLNDEKEYFVKTGTYSSKFDFRNCYVHGAKEVQELGEYLLFIHFQALQMASPLSTPCIYGASTTTEWVVREFIHDKENCPCIYKGLPLHTEYRIFVDCDRNCVLSTVPYWDPETMKKRFNSSSNYNDIHDAIIFASYEDALMTRFSANKDIVTDHIRAILPDLNLTGQWSIDVMQNGNDFWIIDMALAETSAFYESVPQEMRHPTEENWLPKLMTVKEEK